MRVINMKRAAIIAAAITTAAAVTGCAGGPAAPAAPEAQVQTVYEIGSTGPAGGLVFYDKGSDSGGWRYMEAAPVDLGPAILIAGGMTENVQKIWLDNVWAVKDDNRRGVGKGKYNTEYLVEMAVLSGGGSGSSSGWAVRMCGTYKQGGFDDWFIPSRDELNLMYSNLQTHGIGNFRPEWYWSSTGDGRWQAAKAWCVNFADGKHGTNFLWQDECRVRPVRQF
jgi:hypothetical protein